MHLRLSSRAIRSPALWLVGPVEFGKSSGPVQGGGKSGGARIIYYNRLANEEIWLLTIYAKGDRSTIPARELRTIKEAIYRGQEERNEP